MSMPIEILLVVCLSALAFITIQTPKLRRSAIFLGAFSLLCSFAYLFYHAPDVAIAEAVIGCTLSTILLLIALKKYHVITIFYVEHEESGSIIERKERSDLITSLEHFLTERGFEPQLIMTHLDERLVCQNECFNLLIEHTPHGINIYASGIQSLTPQIEEYIEEHKPPHLDIAFFSLAEEPQGGDLGDDE